MSSSLRDILGVAKENNDVNNSIAANKNNLLWIVMVNVIKMCFKNRGNESQLSYSHYHHKPG